MNSAELFYGSHATTCGQAIDLAKTKGQTNMNTQTTTSTLVLLIQSTRDIFT